MQRAAAETEVRKVQTRLAQLELDHASRLRADALVSSAEVERRTAQRDGERPASKSPRLPSAKRPPLEQKPKPRSSG